MVLPIIGVVAGILIIIPLVFFLYSVVEVLRIVLVILAIPFLVKFIADYIANYQLELGPKTSMILGLAGAIPIAIILYVNFWALFIGVIILLSIYFGARYYVGDKLKPVFSIKEWFEGEKNK